MGGKRMCIAAAVVVMGLSGVVAQIVLLREFLIVFSGNEFSIGIVLANWLILEAAGSYFVGKRIEKVQSKLEAFATVTILFSLAFFVAIFLIRILKPTIGVSIGESVSLLPMFISSFLILLPVSMLHGALFTFSCEIYSSLTSKKHSSAGWVYALETIGTVIGSVIATYFLVFHLNAFEMASGVALANLLVCFFLLAPSLRSRTSRGTMRLILIPLMIFLLLATTQSNRIHRYSIDLQWRPQNVVHYENSRYGNICVVENQGQYIFFESGIPGLITPIPDIPFVEEFVHIPLLAHPNPRKILILSGGAGGVINEALKHSSIEEIDYAELDPLVLDLVKRFSTSITQRELSDRRVRVKHIDGRLFLKVTDQRYDVIMVGLTEPSNLQTNRFFTKEFFVLAKSRLQHDGILIFGLPGSLTHLSKELIDLNGSVFYTLSCVFSHVRVIPGDGVNFFLSSDSPEITKLTKDSIIEAVVTRNLAANTMIPRNIEQRLHSGWHAWFLELIKDSSRKINSDLSPIAVFYSVSHWNSLFAPSLQPLFDWISRIELRTIGLFLSLAFVAIFLYLILAQALSAKVRPSEVGIQLAIMTTGFSGMIFDLVLIFTFQSIYGYVFSWIGLLPASFMVGAASGAMLSSRLLKRIEDCLKHFMIVEASLCCFSLCFMAFFLVGYEIVGIATGFPLRFAFLLISGIAGFLVGLEFPLANSLVFASGKSTARSAGLLYASDLIGGWFGGITCAVILLPVLGLSGTCITVGLVKALSLIVNLLVNRVSMRKRGVALEHDCFHKL